MRFDLTDLRLFANVVDAGSITAGAEATSMALASASARLKALEARFDVALLERGPRGVVPTAAGAALAARARDVLAQLDRAEADLADRRALVRVLGNTAACRVDLPPALEDFVPAHRGVGMTVEERCSEAIVEAITAGGADLGIVSDAVERRGLDARPLRDDPLVAVMPGRHALAERAALRLEDLVEEPFVGLPRGRALQDHVDAQAQRLGAVPRYRLRVEGFGAICRLAARGAGVAIVPRAIAVRCAPAEAGVVALDDAWARRRLLLCARSLADLAPAVHRFADALARRRPEVA